MSLKIKLLIGAGLVGFGILHVVGIAMINRTVSKQPMEALSQLQSSD